MTGLAVDEEPAGPVAVGADDEAGTSPPPRAQRRGTPPTSSTQAASVSANTRRVSPVTGSASNTSTLRWSRDCTPTSSPWRLHATLVR